MRGVLGPRHSSTSGDSTLKMALSSHGHCPSGKELKQNPPRRFGQIVLVSAAYCEMHINELMEDGQIKNTETTAVNSKGVEPRNDFMFPVFENYWGSSF